MGKVNIFKGLYAECGPQFGFLYEKNTDGKSFTDDSNRFDFSVLGGLGYKITKNFFIDAPYCLQNDFYIFFEAGANVMLTVLVSPSHKYANLMAGSSG